MHRTALQPGSRNVDRHGAVSETLIDSVIWVRRSNPARTAGRKEIAFVDAGLPDHAILEAAIRPGVAVVRFGGECDGLLQLGQATAMLESYDAVHILCHGEPGQLMLGQRVLDASTLSDDVTCALVSLGAALREGGDLLLYACSAGAGAKGRRFVDALAHVTGASVAASSTPTGDAAQGGTWSLPVRSGAIATPLALDAVGGANWPHLMTSSITFDLSSGTLRDNTTFDGNVVQTLSGVTMTVSAGSAHDAYIYDTTQYGDLAFSPPHNYIATSNNSLLDIDTSGGTPAVQVSFGAAITLNSLDLADLSNEAMGSRIRITSLNTSDTTVVDIPAQSDAHVALGWVGVTGFTITAESFAPDTDYGSNLIPLGIDNIVVTPASLPTITVASATLSNDTGPSATDFVTHIANQTVSGTLSAALNSGESVEVSYDGGTSWHSAAAFTTGSNTWSDTATLSGSNTFEARVTNASGSSTAYTHTYTLDQVAPTTTVGNLSFSNDTGASNSDFVTKTPAQTVGATLSAVLVAGEVLYGSLDNGATWTDITASVSGTSVQWNTTLSSSRTLLFKVTDLAGNDGVVASQAYTYDTTGSTTTVSGLALSADTGISTTDFITKTASQTVAATLSAALASGESLFASTDNGATWTDISASVSGTAISWNTSLQAGNSTLQFEVVDVAGNDGAVTSQAYTVDTLAPAAPTRPAMSALEDSGASNGDQITNVNHPTLGGTAEPNASVTVYDTDGTALGTTTANGSGVWSFSHTLIEGNHSLTVKATDAAGNVSAASVALAVTIDTTAPTGVALNTHSTTTTAAVQYANVATLGSTDATNVTYSLVGGNGTNDADNGKFTVAGNALNVGGTSLAPGTYHIYLQALDMAGNASTVAETITVNDAPSVTSIVRAGGAAAGVSASATSIAYTVTFSSDVTGVDASDFTLSTTGNAGGHIASVVAAGSASVYTVTVDSLSGDGTLRLDLKPSGTGIQSSAGGTIGGGYTAGATFALDHTAPAAPAAPALSPLSDSGAIGDGITNVTTPIVGGSAEAGAGVALYDSDGTTMLGTATADAAGHWSIASSTLSNGSHTLTAKATDAAGNVSVASVPLNLTIATSAAAPTAPVLASASDSGTVGDGITKVVTPVVTGHASAGATVKLYDTDGTTVIGATVADGAGNWDITSSTLANGSHTLTAKQIDLAGNLSSVSAGLALTIDTETPDSPTALALAPGSDSGAQGDNSTVYTTPMIRGTGEANASVTLYDTSGTSVLGTATADGSGNWSITSSTLALGAHTLTAKQTDAAGNASAASAPLALFIETPVASTPSTPTVDGVAVATQTVTLPGGGSGTQVTVPVVTSGRVETTGSAGVADIPLATANGGTLLLSQLPVGFGLTASGGASQSGTTAAQQLIQAITAATLGHTSGDQDHLTGNGISFLKQLATSAPLLVETVVPTTTATAPAGALTLTGTSSDTQRTALVIDATHMATNAKIALNQVDFAAIVGATSITADTSGQVLTGDAAAQTFTVASSAAGSVFAGGGNDTLVFSIGAMASVHAAVTSASLPAADNTTILHGGLDSDTAIFSGNRADYLIDSHEGYLLVTPKAEPDTHAVLIDVENIQFADTSVAVTNSDALGSIAGLYQEVLGRQADYLGINFWGTIQTAGASLGEIAVEMMRSPEAQARVGDTFNGNAAHDVEMLYQQLLDRTSDAAGLAYWTDAMAHGASLDAVAQDMVVGAEGQQHKLGALQWDFLV